jgi:succinoglycan biosynthesis protein ExoA
VPDPSVSIIIPCYNEQATIRLLLDALLKQNYPLPAVEVIIADGLSTDRTRAEISAFQTEQPGLAVRVVDNPKRTIPAALNTALGAASGEIIVRLDAHSIPEPDYIRRCVDNLVRGCGDNVGGIWLIRPGGSGWLARSIAIAAAHPLGVGDALYRFTNQAGPVDTVPFGAFRRELLARIGGFDESLLTNEDYEFNVRIRQSGGTVWLDPAIRSTYFARATLGALARQYWRYGYWKARMLRRYPGTLRWRQVLPPAFVIGLLGLGLLTVILALAHWPMGAALAGGTLAVVLLFYLGVLFFAGLQAALRKRDSGMVVGVPLVIATMHLVWGSGLLYSLLFS